jgi:hypothetical protein
VRQVQAFGDDLCRRGIGDPDTGIGEAGTRRVEPHVGRRPGAHDAGAVRLAIDGDDTPRQLDLRGQCEIRRSRHGLRVALCESDVAVDEARRDHVEQHDSALVGAGPLMVGADLDDDVAGMQRDLAVVEPEHLRLLMILKFTSC